MIEVQVTGGTISPEEQQAYVRRAEELYADRMPDMMSLHIDGDYVDVEYHFYNRPFERIRRITGYLVGTMEKWNNAKAAEEADRVKHDIV